MDEKQLLKEIAYYSRVIDQYKKWGNTSTYTNNYHRKTSSTPLNNKYKLTAIPADKRQPVVTKLHNSVHINPNFAKVSIKNIHVNPKVIKKNVAFENLKAVPNVKLNVQSSPSPLRTLPRKRRLSICTKYKIVKSQTMISPKILISKTPSIKTKYKIDRRNKETVNKSLTKKKVVTQGISDILRTNLFKNKTWRKNVKNNSSDNSLMSISGVLYKRSKNKLQKVQNASHNKTFNKTSKKCLVSSKGYKYLMDSNRKTLKLISSSKYSLNNSHRKINVKGVTYVQKTKNTFVKINSQHNKQRIKLQTLKLRKNNIPCPVYRRFGKCRRKDIGRCNFHHNPDQITLCKKFLQGACVDKDCLLSHKTTLEKMPTCKYFLEGCCIRNDCQYLHVKINPKADICRSFLEGFCQDGVNCNKRHQFLCPDFERDGSCKKTKCRYPHREKNIEPKSAKDKKIKKQLREKQEILPVEVNRYYEECKLEDRQILDAVDKSQVSDEISDSDEEIYKRPKLGNLPSFIPIE